MVNNNKLLFLKILNLVHKALISNSHKALLTKILKNNLKALLTKIPFKNRKALIVKIHKTNHRFRMEVFFLKILKIKQTKVLSNNYQ